MPDQTDHHLKGMTWSHHRGIAPMLATSEAYAARHPGVSFHWDDRPLQDFESQPLRELAEDYDLIIIDHPHLGEAVREGLLVDLAQVGRDQALAQLAREGLGRSHTSYQMGAAQYALAVDAATGVACYRPDLLAEIPQNWDDVMALARTGVVALPLRAPHALMAFFWLANAAGFNIAPNPETLLSEGEINHVLDQLSELAAHVPAHCYQMDPIALFDAMASEETASTYCAHGYGYISYARAGFRPHPLAFTDIADAGGRGPGGTVLGGTGIAVSALSDKQEIAIDYAFEIASAACQTGLWVDSGGQPGNRAAWLDAGCNDRTGRFLNATLATLDGAWVRPRYDGYLGFQTAGSQAISDHLSGEIDRPTARRRLQELYRQSQG